MQLDAVQAAIRKHEQPKPTPPAPKSAPARWLAEYDISAAHRLFQIHTGDCAMTGHRTKPISEDEARRGIVDAGACQFCRPDRALGVLD